jgi:hypothetical protein
VDLLEMWTFWKGEPFGDVDKKKSAGKIPADFFVECNSYYSFNDNS